MPRDVVAWEGAMLPCAQQAPNEPAVVALLHHEHYVVFPQLQLVRLLRLVGVEDSVAERPRIVVENSWSKVPIPRTSLHFSGPVKLPAVVLQSPLKAFPSPKATASVELTGSTMVAARVARRGPSELLRRDDGR